MAKSLGEVYMKFSVKDGQVVVQQIDKIEGKLQTMGKTGQQAGDRLTKGFQALGALPATLGIGIVVAHIHGLLQKAMQAEEGIKRLRGALAARGMPSFAAEEMKKVAQQYERVTNISAGEIVGGMATAITQGAKWNDLLRDMDGLLGAIYTSGKDLNTVMETYGGVQAGNTFRVGQMFRELGALNTEEEKTIGFYAKLNSSRGQAQKAAQTELGLVRQGEIQYGKLQKAMGEAAAKGLVPLLNVLVPVFQWLSKTTPEVRGLAVAASIAIPIILSLAAAIRLVGISTTAIGPMGVIVTILSLLPLLWIRGAAAAQTTARAMEEASEELAQWNDEIAKAEKGGATWGQKLAWVQEQLENTRLRLEELRKKKEEYEKGPGAEFYPTIKPKDPRIAWKNEVILLTAKETALLDQEKQTQMLLNIEVEKQAGNMERVYQLTMEQMELDIRRGRMKLGEAKEKLRETEHGILEELKAQGLTEEKHNELSQKLLQVQTKIEDINDRIGAQREKEISESEHRRLLTAQIADLETGRHENVMKVTRAIIEERKARGATIGVLEEQLNLGNQLIEEETRIQAEIDKETQKRKELSAAYDAIMKQYAEAAAAKGAFEFEFKLVTPEEQIQRLVTEIEGLTGIQPEMKVEAFQGIADEIQRIGDTDPEKMNRVVQAFSQWYDLSTALSPEMQVLQGAADRLASSFEGAFVEVFKTGKLSMKSFEKAFSMMVANMAATLLARAAIFGFLSLLIPGGSAFWGGKGVIGKIFGFQRGGYTGRGRPDEAAGVVHREEVVVPLGDKPRALDLMGMIIEKIRGGRPFLPMMLPEMAMQSPASGSQREMAGLRKEFQELRRDIARQPDVIVQLTGKLEVTLDALRFRLAEAERRAGNRGI